MKLVLVKIFLLFFLLLLGGGFVAFRAAVYDGQYLATWSPLAKDDASYCIIISLFLGGGFVAFRAALGI